MIYVISDLHGYPLEKFKALLDKAGFTDADTLYMIGDVIDRNGDGGVEMLLHIMERPNFVFMCGNHEDMLLNCSYLFDGLTEESLLRLPDEKLKHFSRWMRNGGGVTLERLMELKNADPERFGKLMRYIENAPVFLRVNAGGREVILVHGGFKDFSRDKEPEEYDRFDLLWERPKLGDEYFDGVLTVLGHTPTGFYGPEYEGKIIRTRTWINIDSGAAYGFPPALLRLDDLKVFYGE